MVARRQLNELKLDSDLVRNRLASGRWVAHGPCVVSTTTGDVSRAQLRWLGVLHAGPAAVLGGLSAAEVHGLEHWHRDDITVWIPYAAEVEPLDGIVYRRTRRPLTRIRVERSGWPVARIEPAILLFGAYQRSRRTAQGAVAAAIQQGLATPDSFTDWLEQLGPLRWAGMFRETLADIAGGSQSVAEIDVVRLCRRMGIRKPDRQRKRRDADGKTRWTDCEWDLPGGQVLVLEVDGAFHMEVEHWEDDMRRQRRISHPGRTVVRCSARELRDEPEEVGRDLLALGAPPVTGCEAVDAV